MIAKLSDWVSRALLAVAAVLAFLICFVVCADVIGRVVFNSPLKGTPEIVSFSIVIICFLQAPFAIRSGGMIWVDALFTHFPDIMKRICEIAGCLLGVTFFALICWGSIDPAMHAWTSNEFEGEGARRLPVWPVRFVILLGTFLAAFNYLLMAIERWRAPLGEAMRAPGSPDEVIG
jgi:TRAP-type C4-dicarboxylate transport system permease small subunit